MTKKFVVLSMAAIATIAAASPASASEAKGYHVRYVEHSRDFCVTPLTAREARRLDIALNRTECHTRIAWAKMGLMFSQA